jgi:hypothetical protein
MYCIYKFELSILVYSSTASNALNRKVPPQALLGIVGLIHSHSLERLELSSRFFIFVLLGVAMATISKRSETKLRY